MSEFHALRWTTSSSELFLPLAETATKLSYMDWHQSAQHVVDSVDQGLLLKFPQSLLLPEAEKRLNEDNKRFAVVVDASDKVVGVVQARELHSRHSAAMANLFRLPWHELQVSYIMQPAERQPIITEQQVEAARIGDIAATMQEAGKDFVWVTDDDRIIGVISSLSIVARTGESVRLYPRADTFAEVFNALKHPELGDV